MINFTDVVEEMNDFLINYQNALRLHNDYEETFALKVKCLNVNRNYSEIEEG